MNNLDTRSAIILRTTDIFLVQIDSSLSQTEEFLRKFLLLLQNFSMFVVLFVETEII
jgi:hypothetical protein